MFTSLKQWQNDTGMTEPDNRPDPLKALDFEVKQLSDYLSIYDRIDIAFKTYQACSKLETIQLDEKQKIAVNHLKQNCLNCLKAVFQVENEETICHLMQHRLRNKEKAPFYIPNIQRQGLPNPEFSASKTKFHFKKARVQIKLFKQKKNILMLEKFKEEQAAGVVYFGYDVEKYRLIICDGKLYQFKQVILETRGVATHLVPFDTQGKQFLFAIDTHGNIFAHPDEPKRIHHSSFTNGNGVMMAGAIKVLNGDVIEMLPLSGHYLPTKENLECATEFLQSKKLNLSKCQFVESKSFISERYDVSDRVNDDKYILPAEVKHEITVEDNFEEERKNTLASKDGKRIFNAFKWAVNSFEFKIEALTVDTLARVTQLTNAANIHCTLNCGPLSAALLFNLKSEKFLLGIENIFPVYSPCCLEDTAIIIFGRPLTVTNGVTVEKLPNALLDLYERTHERVFCIGVNYGYRLAPTMGHCFNAIIFNEGNQLTVKFADAWWNSVYDVRQLNKTYHAKSRCNIFWHTGEKVDCSLLPERFLRGEKGRG